MTKVRKTLLERFEEKYTINESTGCWDWTAYKNNKGYGKIGLNGKADSAYRVSYTLFVGEIPEGFDIDHLCRNPGCVNPAHLEAVTPTENILRGIGPTATNKRKTHCIQGHPFDENNTEYRENGRRQCKICKKAYDEYRHKNKTPDQIEKIKDYHKNKYNNLTDEEYETHKTKAREWYRKYKPKRKKPLTDEQKLRNKITRQNRKLRKKDACTYETK